MITNTHSNNVAVEADVAIAQNETEKSASHMPASLRLAATSAPAAAVTFGLFLIMGGLIAVDFKPAEASEVREITSIIPEKVEPIELPVRPPVELLQTLDAPPPPRLTATKDDIKLPTPIIEGVAPKGVRFERVQSLDVNPHALPDSEVTPIRPPVPTYPGDALGRGLEGECQVTFDVNVRGRPYNINADCTNRVFKREAERAISKVEFVPQLVKGKAQERRNVVYPLVFSLT